MMSSVVLALSLSSAMSLNQQNQEAILEATQHCQVEVVDPQASLSAEVQSAILEATDAWK